MDIVQGGNVYCGKCELSFANVEPELICRATFQDGQFREYIFCPKCLGLISVTNTGTESKNPIKIKSFHIDGRKVLNEISESGEEGGKRAEYIKHVIRTKRAELQLDPIDF